MLKQVAEGVWIHNSEFIDTKSTVVEGKDGVLLIDPGITSAELADLAKDLKELGQPVVAGFSTHPDWDHVLWSAELGDVARYGTARGAASMKEFLSNADWRTQLADFLPPEQAAEIPTDDLFGQITALPAETAQIPWDGPKIRIIEHNAHAKGHAALFIEERGVLVAGDMLSDELIPFLDLEAADPTDDYLTALGLFEDIADDVAIVIPGHGTIGQAGEVRARIAMDRAYVQALRDGHVPEDPRVGPNAKHDWLAGMPAWQLDVLNKKSDSSSPA